MAGAEGSHSVGCRCDLTRRTALLSAAAGMAGGQRAKSAMYLYLIPFQVKLVLDPEVNVGGANGKFDEDGRLTDETTKGFVQKLMDALKAEI